LPRDVFFFFGVTAFPLSAACFCFFFAGIPTSLLSRLNRYVIRIECVFLVCARRTPEAALPQKAGGWDSNPGGACTPNGFEAPPKPL
jgi:hypothetical protein